MIRRNQDWSGVEKTFFAIISRSTSLILVIFFCYDENDELYPTKKKIAEIGSLDREIIFSDSDRVGSGPDFRLIWSGSDLKIQNTNPNPNPNPTLTLTLTLILTYINNFI